MSNFDVPEGCCLGFFCFSLYVVRLGLGGFFSFRFPKALHRQHILGLSTMNTPFFLEDQSVVPALDIRIV